jgi:transposase
VSDIVKLSEAELQRVEILQACLGRRMKNHQAATKLGITVRQLQRLKRAFKHHGIPALASKKRGRTSNNQLPAETEKRACELLHTRYPDFGPTLAHEKLVEVHHLHLSCETVRRLMMADGLWKPHRAKRAVIHPLRERRAQRGELVQIDGSPFNWFEGRAPTCTLLVFVDDATGELMTLFFAAAETTHSYFQATEQYLCEHGRPLTFYSDKFGVFRINHPNDLKSDGVTQFARALYELDIELICANTPQAKGRVERANQTLQDRLVKELRLRGISDLPTANAFLPEFRADLKRRFAVQPREPQDAHRPLRVSDDLTRILALRELRTLSKNLTLNYNRTVYQIHSPRPAYALRHAKVEVRERWDGTVQILYRDKPLDYGVYREPPRQAELIPSKELNRVLDARTVRRKRRSVQVPPADHPWRKFKYGRSSSQP